MVSHSFTLYSRFLPSLNEYSFSSECTTTYPGRSFLGFSPRSALARSFAIRNKLAFRWRWWALSARSASRAALHSSIAWLAFRAASWAFLSASLLASLISLSASDFVILAFCSASDSCRNSLAYSASVKIT